MTVRDQQIVTAAFDQASEAMMITDAAEKVVRINRQFTQLTGYDPSEIIGQTPALLRSGKNDQNLFNEFWSSLNASGRWQGDIWNRKKNGRLFVADLTVSSVLNHYGKVSYYLAVYRDITAAKEDQLKQQMRDNRESHTFLLNRAAFFEQMRDVSARPARETERSALILLNLDRFSEINDTYGVAMGDEILSETARRLRRCLRDSDVISRMNGDEFGVLLPELSAADDIEKVGAKILSRLLEPHDVGGPQPVLVTCSLGITLIPPGSTTDQVLRLANRALSAAKQDGGRQYQTIDVAE